LSNAFSAVPPCADPAVRKVDFVSNHIEMIPKGQAQRGRLVRHTATLVFAGPIRDCLPRSEQVFSLQRNRSLRQVHPLSAAAGPPLFSEGDRCPAFEGRKEETSPSAGSLTNEVAHVDASRHGTAATCQPLTERISTD
jgi:hypothetical protein